MIKNALNINKLICSVDYELSHSIRRILSRKYRRQENIMNPENQKRIKTAPVPGQNPGPDMQVLPCELDAIEKAG